jgi:hypothetical protein
MSLQNNYWQRQPPKDGRQAFYITPLNFKRNIIWRRQPPRGSRKAFYITPLKNFGP